MCYKNLYISIYFLKPDEIVRILGNLELNLCSSVCSLNFFKIFPQKCYTYNKYIDLIVHFHTSLIYLHMLQNIMMTKIYNSVLCIYIFTLKKNTKTI